MKNLSYFLVGLCLILLSGKISQAQDVKLETGNLDFLAGETQLNVVFDFVGMKVSELNEEYYLKQKKLEFRKPADQEKFVKQWDADKSALWEPAFIEQLNKGLKKQQIEADKDLGAKYTLKVSIQKIEPGYFTGSNSDKREAFVNIYIQIYETQNPTNVLCTMGGEKLFGVSTDATAMKETNFRIKMCFENAGEKTAKCIDKICTLKDKETVKAAKKKEEVLPFEKEEDNDKEVTDEENSGKKNKKSKADQDEEKPAPSDKGKKKGDKKIDKELDE